MTDPWKDEETKPDNDAAIKARDREEQIREERRRERAIELMHRMHVKTFAEALELLRTSEEVRDGRPDKN